MRREGVGGGFPMCADRRVAAKRERGWAEGGRFTVGIHMIFFCVTVHIDLNIVADTGPTHVD